MSEPIISPWVIYWIGRLDFIRISCCIAGLALTLGTIFLSFMFITDLESGCYDADGREASLKFFKIVACLTLIVDMLAMFVPTKSDFLAMYVAKNVTPAAIKVTGELADKAVDKLIEKILKISEATKEDK